jgi:hypothetical protein
MKLLGGVNGDDYSWHWIMCAGSSIGFLPGGALLLTGTCESEERERQRLVSEVQHLGAERLVGGGGHPFR